MTTVTIEVSGVDTAERRMKAAFRGEVQGCFISFPSHEDLWAAHRAPIGLGRGEAGRVPSHD